MSIIFFLIWLGLMIFSALKARDFSRSIIGWTIVGLVTTPVLSIVLLYLLGDKYDRRN